MSLSTDDGRPYVVPDFAADEDVRFQYNNITKQLITAAIAEALRKMKDEYEYERQRLEASARAAATVLAAVEAHAHVTRAKYAKVVPKGRTASGVVRPPTLFFDNLLSMGAADKLYNAAADAAALKRDAAVKAHAISRDLKKISGKLESLLVVRELEVRRHFKTPNGKLELEADPRLHELARQCAEIEQERAEFRARSEAGEVTDEELRDRSMAHDGLHYVDGDVRGLHARRGKEIRYGKLRFFTFLDREEKPYLIEYSPELIPLLEMTFDVVHVNDRYLITRIPAADFDGEKKARKHAGPDPRAYMGIDPVLRQALRNFVNRERSNI